MKTIINTRKDLDALIGTSEYEEFIKILKGSIVRKQDIAVRPNNYNQPDYDGDAIEPIWSNVEDLSVITRFGFTKEELQK